MANHTQRPNRLIHETSPYLLQHAYNPVDWFPWGEEALEKARKEDKPILVSIGYSACHWCHVMERESFESPEIAEVMNQHFVNIKIDREERPDLDQIYMEAVQLMGLNGGWPLNVFLLPDTVPFYGGTYFPPDHWKELLRRIRNTWVQARPQLEDSGRSMAEALRRSELAMFNLPKPVKQFSEAQTDLMFDLLSQKFDPVKGGTSKSPKFPMPCIWEFLLRYAAVTGNGGALRQLTLTLDRIGAGGIYDQLGGGFARYSVDAEWFAPHFEKMLYDNGQLLSLYAHAFTLTRRPRYAHLLSQTIGWMERELLHPEGGFFSALDADSEGEEGRFYVWEWNELQAVLGADTEQVAAWFNALPEGNWEHGRSILYLNPQAADQQEPAAVTAARPLLMAARDQRPRPGLDDKILASWNGWALKGLSDAAAATGNPAYLEMAARNAHFIRQNLFQHGRLWHTWKNGKAAHPAFLEDYAALIAGLISLYQTGFDEQWLRWATELTQYTISQFFDPEEHLFFFTDSDSEVLVTRKKEIFDNVIPASNSVMAWNLHLLGELLGNASYTELSEQMVATVAPLFEREVQYLSNWASLYLAKSRPMLQIVVTGAECRALARSLNQLALPGKIILAAETDSELPLFEDRFLPEKRTAVFICQNRTCQLPAYSLEQAVEQLRHLGQRV